MSIIPNEWTLLAEGGATTVWSYHGSQNNFVHKVLRLRKRERAAPLIKFTEEDRSVAFSKRVIGKLLPQESFVQLESVAISEHALLEFAFAYAALPNARNAQQCIDTGRNYAVLAENLLEFGDDASECLTVEIKASMMLKHNYV